MNQSYVLDLDFQEEIIKLRDLFGAQALKGLKLRRRQKIMVIDLIPQRMNNIEIPTMEGIENIAL